MSGGAAGFFCTGLPLPRIGVSACLAGHAVRYDGTDKRHDPLLQWIAPHAELLPLCPEAALGIPRPPVQLHASASGLRAIGVEDAGLDVTDALLAFNAQQRSTVSRLCGVILKARSPSCGVNSTPIITAGNITTGDGLFAGFIRQHFPWLPLCDEAAIASESQAEAFLQQARVVCDAHEAVARGKIDDFLMHYSCLHNPCDPNLGPLFEHIAHHRRLTL